MFSNNEYQIDVTFQEDNSFNVTFEPDNTFDVDFGQTSGVSGDEYQGTYEVTPTTSEQTLSTTNKVLTHNVIIHPIPQNYGLITWNGATLRIS